MSSSPKQYDLPPYPVIPTQAVSGNITSLVTDIFHKDNITYQFVWTGTVAGSFAVQTSLDFKPNPSYTNLTPLNAGTWDTVPLTGAAAGGVAGSGTIELNQLGANYSRVVFTYISGSGNLTVTVTGKAE